MDSVKYKIHLDKVESKGYSQLDKIETSLNSCLLIWLIEKVGNNEFIFSINS